MVRFHLSEMISSKKSPAGPDREDMWRPESAAAGSADKLGLALLGTSEAAFFLLTFGVPGADGLTKRSAKA